MCATCQKKLKPLFLKFRIGQIHATAIYKYNEDIKTLLYQFKGCYDIELANIFFEKFAHELHILYHDFVLVPAPSFQEDNEKREFNHVIEMFKPLGLAFLPIIEKFSPFKQADHNHRERKAIRKHLKINENYKMYGKKILIVDDVYTTGSTVKAMIQLIKPLKPKKIEVLVMSKTFKKELDFI